MKKNYLLILLATIIMLPGCKSGLKQLEKGNYYNAVMTSISRLRKNPDSRKAKSTLHQGYPLAKSYHEDLANRAKKSQAQFKWETVFDQYRMLNVLYEEIQRCPACRPLAKNARSYQTEQDEASLKAAEVRYALGDQSMEIGTIQDAKQAFFHYRTADSYRPNFRDVRQKMNDARWAATTKVVVEPIPIHSASLQISNEFFQNQINQYISSTGVSDFVRFFTPVEAHTAGLNQPDQVIMMNFDDFVVGQHFVKERVEKVSRDSVIIGYADKAREQPIYGTVTAELRCFHKEVVSSGLLNFQIMDLRSNRLLVHEKFDGTHVWACDWASFNGDERALTNEQIALSKNRELMPPPPQTLFVEFTKPIYDQVVNRIRSFYQNY